MADLVEQYVKKGDRLYIEGRIEYSQTEDDKGNQRFWTDIVVREMVMLGGAGGSSGGGGSYDAAPRRRQPAQSGSSQPSPFDADDDDLPF
jgi:single-strand DNA-binding protein